MEGNRLHVSTTTILGLLVIKSNVPQNLVLMIKAPSFRREGFRLWLSSQAASRSLCETLLAYQQPRRSVFRGLVFVT